jgi:hypothetical protein
MVAVPTPTLHYDFAGSGTTAIDATGNGNDGALTRGGSPFDLHSGGKLLISTSTDRLNYVPTTSPVVNSTISMWFTTDGSSAGQLWTLALAPDTSGHRMNINGGTIQCAIRDISGNLVLNYTDDASLSAGTHHVAITYDGDVMRLFQDGVQMWENASLTGALNLAAMDGLGFNIGYDPALGGLGGSPYTVDDVRWWDTVTLTAAQVAAIASGTAEFPSTDPPVAYTEVEWNIGVQAPATASDVYEFRVYDGATPLTYAVTPQLTVVPAAGGTAYDETDLSITIAASVTSTDQADWKSNVGLQVPVVATTTLTDQVDFKSNTGLSVGITATVTEIDQVDYKSNTDLSIPVVATTTITDQADWKSNVGLSVPVVGTVTQPLDLHKRFEVALSVSAVGAVATVDQADWKELVRSIDVVTAVVANDSLTHGGHFDDLGLAVVVVATTTATSQADWKEPALSVPIAATFTAPTQTFTHLGSFDETGRSITITATVTRTDALVVNRTQEGFRWRNDNGNETTATWKAALNVNTAVNVNTNFRLRSVIEAKTVPTSITPIIHYRKQGDTTWLPVPVGVGGGSPVCVSASPNIPVSGGLTTAQIATGTFSTGRIWDDENGTDAVVIGGAAPTDPFAVTSWHSAHWASDPSWTPPADGAAVPNGTGWRDGSGNARHMSQVFGNPIYRASAATLNNRPAIQFDGLDDYMQTASFTNVATSSWVFVAQATVLPIPGNNAMFGGGATPGEPSFGVGTTGRWAAESGFQFRDSPLAADTSKHLFYLRFGGTSDNDFYLDGAHIYSPSFPGTVNVSRWRIAAWATFAAFYAAMNVAFVGFKPGALTGQEHIDLLNWSRSYYGTP